MSQQIDQVDVYINVVNSQKQAVTYLPLSVTDAKTGKILEYYTNSKGKVQFAGMG